MSSASSIWSNTYPRRDPPSDSISTYNTAKANVPSDPSSPSSSSAHPSATPTTTASPSDVMVAPPADSDAFHLFVGDLAVSVRENDLQLAFSAFPSLFQTRLVSSSGKSKSRGYAFLSFRDRGDAERALLRNGELFSGRAMRINWANPKMYKGVCEGLGHVPPQPELERFTVQRAAAPPSASANPIAASTIQPQNPASPPPAPKSSAPGPYSSSPPSYAKVLQQTPASNSTLYVGNLEPSVTQTELTRVFEPFGPIYEVRMHAAARGYAFVKLATHEAAATAIVNLAGARLHQRPIKVGWEKERRDTTPAISPAHSPRRELLSMPSGVISTSTVDVRHSPYDIRSTTFSSSQHRQEHARHLHGHNYSPHSTGVAAHQYGTSSSLSTGLMGHNHSTGGSVETSGQVAFSSDPYASAQHRGASRPGTRPGSPSDAFRTPALSPDVTGPVNHGPYRISTYGPAQGTSAGSTHTPHSYSTSPASHMSGDLPLTPWTVSGRLPATFGAESSAPQSAPAGQDSALWQHPQPGWPSVYHDPSAPSSQPVSSLSSATHSPATSISDMISHTHSSQVSTATSAIGSAPSASSSVRYSAHTAPSTPFSASLSLGLSLSDYQQLAHHNHKPQYQQHARPSGLHAHKFPPVGSEAPFLTTSPPFGSSHNGGSLLLPEWPAGPLPPPGGAFDSRIRTGSGSALTAPPLPPPLRNEDATPLSVARDKGPLPVEAPKGQPHVVGWGEGRYGSGWADAL